MDKEMKIDANRIRAIREARGWSQEHLATVSGLSSRTIQRMETEGKASGETRMAVAAALGIGPEDLLPVDCAPATTTVADDKIGMSRADRAKIVLWIVTLLVAVVMFEMIAGYNLGKDAAERDNRINAACKADSADCRR